MPTGKLASSSAQNAHRNRRPDGAEPTKHRVIGRGAPGRTFTGGRHGPPQRPTFLADTRADQRARSGAAGDGGQARSVIDALLIARQYGAHAIAITGPDSPLAGIADTVLPLTFKEDTDIYKPSSVRYALLAAVDILAMSTAHAVGPKAIESLRRVRQSLASQDIRNPKLPIGD